MSAEETKEKGGAIPLTIVTGFLGSGKTTLINLILKDLVLSHKKLAIIQNEFANGGVEEDFRNTANATVKDSDGSVMTNVIELANGCVCCTVKDNFTIAVEQLASSKKYDYILLECSGMADPGPLIGMFWIDSDLESCIYLDCVITVIDAKYFLSHIKIDNDNENEIENVTFDKKDEKTMQMIHQIAYCDKILINKKDLIKNVNDLQSIKNIIHTISKIDEKSIFITERSKVDDIKDILYVNAFDSKNLESIKKNEYIDSHSHSHSHSHECKDECKDECKHEKNEKLAMSCVHDSSITNMVFENFNDCVNLDQCEEWLSDLLWEDSQDNQDNQDNQNNDEKNKSMQIYRMKGVLPHKDGNNYYLQAVQELFEIEKGLSKWHDDKVCRVIIIGKNLDKESLQKGFDTIFDKKDKPAPSS